MNRRSVLRAGGLAAVAATLAACGDKTKRLISVPAPAPTTPTPPSEPGWDLVILAGQSNMSGAARPITPALNPVNPLVDQWRMHAPVGIQPATDPLDMPDLTTGMGPGLEFGRHYATILPAGRRVLLIPTAFGGTSLVAGPWQRGSGNLYANMLAQTRAALAAANAVPGAENKVVAFLWCQGESDAWAKVPAGQYQTALDVVFYGVRSDLGIIDLPILVLPMVPDYVLNPFQIAIDWVHRTTPNRIPVSAVAPGAQGHTMGDGAHYNPDGQRINGRDLFKAYQRMLNAGA